jgi:ariadne-1
MDNYYDEIGSDYYNEYQYESFPGISLTRQTSYSIVKASDLEKLRSILIQECEEFTCLDREEATILLISYQWNMDSLKDKWYEDTEENRRRCGLDFTKEALTTLNKKKVKQNNSDCYICMAPKDSTFYALKCQHYFCGDCWKGYLESRLEDILTCISSTCPQEGCNFTVPENAFRLFIKGSKLKEFEKVIYKNFTDNNVDMKWCSAPDCGICVRSISHFGKEVTCECGNVFCFKCGREGHRPCQCELIESWQVKNTSESENVKWLEAHTKKCPNCHKFIEKNQGCNHMTCRKEAGGCGYEFCWICLGEWKPHGSNYYQCNQFNNEEVKKKENDAQRAKTDLEKYIWHFDRYVNHDKAIMLCKKLKILISSEIQTFISLKNLPYDEVRFLEEAVETIVKSRRTLKNTYIFAFYMKTCKERLLFEHNQYLLENDADKLHEMMENDSKKKLLEIDNYEQFMKEWTIFKSNVTNLATATVKYQENLLNEIENKMIDLVDYQNINK